MERIEYETMYRVEDGHWWYRGLHDLLLAFIGDAARALGRPLRLLDAGCGTGKLLSLCTRHEAQGLDLSEDALRLAGRRGLSRLTQGSVAALPFEDRRFDLVVSADVLCSLEPGRDRAALAEFARVLSPGGTLLVHLPAYDSLQSRHDRAVHIRHRYRAGEVREMLIAAGLLPRRVTYRNTILFPVAALVRLFGKLTLREGVVPSSDLGELPGPANRALAACLFAENRLIRRGVDLPFGLSVFAVAVRP